MDMRTTDDDFDHQLKVIISEMKEDWEEEKSDLSLEDYIWENREEFGKLVFEAGGEQYGYEIFEK